jgi:hypothetical protein
VKCGNGDLAYRSSSPFRKDRRAASEPSETRRPLCGPNRNVPMPLRLRFRAAERPNARSHAERGNEEIFHPSSDAHSIGSDLPNLLDSARLRV